MKQYLPFFFLYFFGVSVFGQTSKELQAIVWSGNTQETLPGASVTIYYQGKVSGLIANKKGRFSIPAATFYDSVKVSMVGHNSKLYFAQHVDAVTDLEVRLDIAPASLQEVVIFAV